MTDLALDARGPLQHIRRMELGRQNNVLRLLLECYRGGWYLRQRERIRCHRTIRPWIVEAQWLAYRSVVHRLGKRRILLVALSREQVWLVIHHSRTYTQNHLAVSLWIVRGPDPR